MRATRRYGLTLAAVSCCILVPLTACGSGKVSGNVQAGAADHQAGFSTGDLASAAASARPGTPPATPGAPAAQPSKPVETHTAASAERTLSYFWDAYNYAYQTFDTGPLDSISQQTCSVCSEVRNDVLSIQGAGMRVEGYQVATLKVGASGRAGGTTVKVVATIHRDDGRAVDAKGQATELPGFGVRRCIASMTWNGTTWVITKIVTEEV